MITGDGQERLYFDKVGNKTSPSETGARIGTMNMAS